MKTGTGPKRWRMASCSKRKSSKVDCALRPSDIERINPVEREIHPQASVRQRYDRDHSITEKEYPLERERFIFVRIVHLGKGK